MSVRKIILPQDPEQKDYIIYLYKNRNNYHNMNNKDIDNLIKIMAGYQLTQKDYPIIKKTRTIHSQLEGFYI